MTYKATRGGGQAHLHPFHTSPVVPPGTARVLDEEDGHTEKAEAAGQGHCSTVNRLVH